MPSGARHEPGDRAKRAFFGRRKGHPLQAAAGGAVRDACCRGSRSISRARHPPISRTLFPGTVEAVRLEIGFGGGEHMMAEAERAAADRLHRRRAVRQRHGQGAGGDRGARASPMSGCISATRSSCSTGCRRARSRASICSIPTLAEAAALEAALRAGCDRRRDRARIAQRRRIPLRQRLAGLRGVDARAPLRSPDFEWTAERADDWRRPGRVSPARATRPKPCGKAARRAI